MSDKTFPALDHVGVFASSLDQVAAQFEQLGFLLTPTSLHSAPDSTTGKMVPSGTANRCAMLESGYLELLAVTDPSLDPQGLAADIKRPAGIHIMAFRCDDARAAASRLMNEGFAAQTADLQRTVDTPTGPQLAKFVRVVVPGQDMPEGMHLTLEHQTPAALWQTRYLSHPNGAISLDQIIVAVDDLDEASVRYNRYFGTPGLRSDGQVWYVLAHGHFVLVDQETLERRFPELSSPALPLPAAMVIGVADLDITRTLLRANNLAFVDEDTALRVPPEHAGGLALVFSVAAYKPDVNPSLPA